jgi:opacity protein-like surface antigen
MPQPKGPRMTAKHLRRNAQGLVLGRASALASTVRVFAASATAFGILAALAPSIASAQPASNCPPGSWFCVEGGVTTAPAPVVVQGGLQPLPPVVVQAPPPVIYQQPPQMVPPPVPTEQVYVRPGQRVVVQNGGTTTVIVNGNSGPPPSARPYTPPPPPGAPPPGFVVLNPNPEYYRQREFGLNLTLQGAILGRSDDSSGRRPSMSGLGLALRYKPNPQLGLEAQLAGYGGTDAAGNRRSEGALQLNAMMFFNTRQRFQPYILAGLGFGGATVSRDSYDGAPFGSTDRFAGSRGNGNYSYVGVQAGIGLEYRLGAHFALNTDLRAFVRGRTDRGGGYEFINAEGRATNKSGGGLFSLGATYYF